MIRKKFCMLHVYQDATYDVYSPIGRLLDSGTIVYTERNTNADIEWYRHNAYLVERIKKEGPIRPLFFYYR